MRTTRTLAAVGGLALLAVLASNVPATASYAHGRGAFSTPGRSTRAPCRRWRTQRVYRAPATTYAAPAPTWTYVPSAPAASRGSYAAASVATTQAVGATLEARPGIVRASGSGTEGAVAPRRYVDANGNVWIERVRATPAATTTAPATPATTAAVPAAPERTTRVLRSVPSSSVEYDANGRPWIRRYVATASTGQGDGLGHAVRTLRVARDEAVATSAPSPVRVDAPAPAAAPVRASAAPRRTYFAEIPAPPPAAGTPTTTCFT